MGCDGCDSLIYRQAGLVPEYFEAPMDVWQVRVPTRDPLKRGRVSLSVRDGRFAATLDRGEYRDRLGTLLGWDWTVVDATRSWDDVKLLEVTMGRLDRWYRDGLLCTGDAAHMMSPVGAAGISPAVRDAVATARLPAGPLRAGQVTPRDLACVQRRRRRPTALTQRSQRAETTCCCAPLWRAPCARTGCRCAWLRLRLRLRLVRRIPAPRSVTGCIGGVGIRPGRAPAFARR